MLCRLCWFQWYDASVSGAFRGLPKMVSSVPEMVSWHIQGHFQGVGQAWGRLEHYTGPLT